MTQIEYLHLWDCKLDDDDARKLVDLLKNQRTAIGELILTQNCIGPRGADAIGEALLEKKTKLKVLSLDENCIGDYDSEETKPCTFFEMLKSNITLERLHMDRNMVGDDICHVLSENPSSAIYDLQLGHNVITDEGAKSLARFLKSNNKLRALKLKGNKVGNNGAIAVANATRSRARDLPMVELSTTKNKLTKKGVAKIEEAEKGKHLVQVEFTTHARPPHHDDDGS
mmetsp:Transcript_14640/g.22300  ORF Transcript_14640/g.22300 Transcript_14640/m.22300 type:complete len:227 (+) Transcript_14640:467-1147(+)